MNRRGFLGSILAAAVAPAIVRADSLMRIVPAETLILRADEYLPGELGGGVLREMWAYDLRRDEMICRYDVTGYNGRGELTQCGVDIRMRGPEPTKEDREPALLVLRDYVRREGVRPIRGVLQIPSGVQGRFV